MNKHIRYFHCVVFILICLTACARPYFQEQVIEPQPIQNKLLLNGRVYTVDSKQPWAEAILLEGSKIRYVGSNDAALKLAGSETVHYNLDGKLVIPGIIDAHTHPGLVAVLGGGEEEDPIPKGSHEEIMAWLDEYAGDNLFTLLITAGSWPIKLYGPEGPHKKDLDKIVSIRPVLLFDDSGHSMWANSSMLRLMGVDSETPDPAPGLSYFVRDDNGEPTGWIKEFAAVPKLTKFMLPGKKELRSYLLAFLRFLSSKGVTTLFDGGNLIAADDVYEVVAELDRENLLPVRYEGVYHIIFPDQANTAIEELERLRKTYSGNRLKFNTIKIHFDGVSEIRTAAMIEPYSDQPDTRGNTLLDEQRLTRFILDLDKKAIDLHLHVVGDQATRTALNAVNAARNKAGRLKIFVTLAHLESVDYADITRFQKLGVFANFTPHWFGGYFGDAIHTLGKERSDNRQLVKSFFDAGAIVSFSSDVTTYPEMDRANPFFGMQIAASRKEPGFQGEPYPPANETLSVERIIQAYTLNGARQLRMDDELGSIEAGKTADLIVLSRDLFSVKLDDIHTVEPVAVLMEGRIVSGDLGLAASARPAQIPAWARD